MVIPGKLLWLATAWWGLYREPDFAGGFVGSLLGLTRYSAACEGIDALVLQKAGGEIGIKSMPIIDLNITAKLSKKALAPVL
jgi:hypothetical protein